MNHLSMERVLERIVQSEQFDEMRVTRDQVHEMFREHLLFSYKPELGSQINQVHDALIQRTIEIAEHLLEDEGYGKPPTPYAFILLGSGGRREQTLWSDQDNGLIYEESDQYDHEELDVYFEKLTSYILHGLDVLGYPPCEGNVISSNPQWRQSLSGYHDMMLRWLEEPTWENVRYLLILADFRCIYGSKDLVAKLKHAFFDYVQEHQHVLKHLLSNTLHHKISLGVFRNLITERYGEDAGGFDIKYGAYIPIVNGIRLLAIQEGIAATSTMERISQLKQLGKVSEQIAKDWETAFGIALQLRDMTPFQIENEKYTTRGKLRAVQLNKETRILLKRCLLTGMDLQKYVMKSIEHIEREKG
ncbi:DUF294 nucleotidyltransferase-like domain-containing protein [Paenibacillus roseipurpureus]|uniref:DUF294 nucleotidyltransferase-like domain-containing protein n=1 Tax=Paenibacillus roseopurpureus TaxID=2918901 RepID=A0AA96LNY1_9BACL|nr:DUF294 nucleotidyltransferase-like domain-containing protein [Paenibacillus sp. MBLB1832]WNR43183.1 DUF294 nucleotidyltransferase-like domain-containing protein [Paenibacillus sp. MBLB1832]